MKQIIILISFLFSAAGASSQIMKKNAGAASPNRVEAKKPFHFMPSALVFARTPTSEYQWGELVSESADQLTVDFMDGWGKCVIRKNGSVASSSGNFKSGDSMFVADIYEERLELDNPTYQLSQGTISKIAYSVNNKPYTFAGYAQFDKQANSLTVYPVAYRRVKYCRLQLLQSKWTIAYSQLPEFVAGSSISAVYYYTDKRRNFFQQL